MRRRIVLIGMGCSFVLLLCTMVALFLDGFYLPGKSCRPLNYPDGRRVATPSVVTTLDPMHQVVQFYDQQLAAQILPDDTMLRIAEGRWVRKKRGDDAYLYVCYGIDINRLTTETGCISVIAAGSQTHVTTELHRSEGGYTPCSGGS